MESYVVKLENKNKLAGVEQMVEQDDRLMGYSIH